MKDLPEVNNISEELLRLISTPDTLLDGAFNIRQDGVCAGRKSTANIKIDTLADGRPGMSVTVAPGTVGETVYIPACVTKGDVNDLVYNDFYIGKDSDVTIVAGCGVHTDSHEGASHDGIHRFFLEEGSHVLYQEKHVGVGGGTGTRLINPVTEVEIKKGGYMEIDSTQIKGVDSTKRVTTANLGEEARLVIREKLMTHGEQVAYSDFSVELKGEDSGADIVSRSVARERSRQYFKSVINGSSRCTGHSACDAIIMDEALVSATPELTANHVDAALIHEAAIGKIAGEQLIKLMTLGLTQEEAEEHIINGFLK